MLFLRSTLLCCIFLSFCGVGAHAASVREMYEEGVDAYNKEEYDRAIGLYQEINKTAPHFAPAYVGIGLALKAKGADLEEVLYYYKTATDMDPANAQAFEQLGRLYYSLNKYDPAEKAFLKALSIDPGLTEARLSLGWVYLLGKSKPAIATKYFQDSYRTTKDPNAYFGLGMAYFANNDRVLAMEVITGLRKMNQDDLANRLEQMVRENRRVNLAAERDPKPAADATLPSTPRKDAGIKVRLSGKLSSVD